MLQNRKTNKCVPPISMISIILSIHWVSGQLDMALPQPLQGVLEDVRNGSTFKLIPYQVNLVRKPQIKVRYDGVQGKIFNLITEHCISKLRNFKNCSKVMNSSSRFLELEFCNSQGQGRDKNKTSVLNRTNLKENVLNSVSPMLS